MKTEPDLWWQQNRWTNPATYTVWGVWAMSNPQARALAEQLLDGGWEGEPTDLAVIVEAALGESRA